MPVTGAVDDGQWFLTQNAATNAWGDTESALEGQDGDRMPEELASAAFDPGVSLVRLWQYNNLMGLTHGQAWEVLKPSYPRRRQHCNKPLLLLATFLK